LLGLPPRTAKTMADLVAPPTIAGPILRQSGPGPVTAWSGPWLPPRPRVACGCRSSQLGAVAGAGWRGPPPEHLPICPAPRGSSTRSQWRRPPNDVPPSLAQGSFAIPVRPYTGQENPTRVPRPSNAAGPTLPGRTRVPRRLGRESRRLATGFHKPGPRFFVGGTSARRSSPIGPYLPAVRRAGVAWGARPPRSCPAARPKGGQAIWGLPFPGLALAFSPTEAPAPVTQVLETHLGRTRTSPFDAALEARSVEPFSRSPLEWC